MRKVAGALIAAWAVAGLVACAAPPAPTPAPASEPVGGPDAQIKAAMIENLRAMNFDGIGTNPDIAVTDGVLIVATSDPAKAAVLCRNVAAVTNDPHTAARLGVKRVVIISGGEQIADCLRRY